jgi:hypothetical protein
MSHLEVYSTSSHNSCWWLSLLIYTALVWGGHVYKMEAIRPLYVRKLPYLILFIQNTHIKLIQMFKKWMSKL